MGIMRVGINTYRWSFAGASCLHSNAECLGLVESVRKFQEEYIMGVSVVKGFDVVVQRAAVLRFVGLLTQRPNQEKG